VGFVTEKKETLGEVISPRTLVFPFQYHSTGVPYSFSLLSKGQAAAEAWGLSNTGVLSEIPGKFRQKNTFTLFLLVFKF
jgi:hypothetical protein